MIDILPLEEKDIPALAALAAKTYEETFGSILPAEDIKKTIQETRTETCFFNYFKTDSFLIAKNKSDLIGYIQISDLKYKVSGFQTEKKDQSINAIYILSDYQGLSIGKQLMNAAISHERLKHLNRIFIDVWEKNKKAVTFYLNYGFKKVGKCGFTIDGKTVGYDLVLMKEID